MSTIDSSSTVNSLSFGQYDLNNMTDQNNNPNSNTQSSTQSNSEQPEPSTVHQLPLQTATLPAQTPIRSYVRPTRLRARHSPVQRNQTDGELPDPVRCQSTADQTFSREGSLFVPYEFNARARLPEMFLRRQEQFSNSSLIRIPTRSNLHSNLNKIIRDELNDVNLCSKLRVATKRDSPINVNKFLSQRSYGNRTPSLPSDFGLQHLINHSLLQENQIELGAIDKVYSSCWLDDDYVLCGTKCNKVGTDF